MLGAKMEKREGIFECGVVEAGVLELKDACAVTAVLVANSAWRGKGPSSWIS